MGLVDEESVRAIREPVTTISSTSVASSLAPGGVCPSADVLAIDAITQAVFETPGLRLVITSPPSFDVSFHPRPRTLNRCWSSTPRLTGVYELVRECQARGKVRALTRQLWKT